MECCRERCPEKCSERCGERPQEWCRNRFVLAALVGSALLWPNTGSAKSSNADMEGARDAVRFQLVHDYLIVLPVMVNGTGPWNFLLDTGCTSSMISDELERQLNAPVVGESAVALLTEMRHDRRVRLNDVLVGHSRVAGLVAMVDKVDNVRSMVPGLSGILGEDFLRQFDVMIDYENRWLYFDEPAPEGERVPFEARSTYKENRTENRLLVKVEFPGTQAGQVVLQVDTAAWITELFPASHVSLLHLAYGSQAGTHSTASGGPGAMPVYEHTVMKLGGTELRNLNVAQSRKEVVMDAAGLLPAALFHRIYISHSGGFMIFNPRVKKGPGRNTVELAAMGKQ